jgi:CBS domain-containing protein
MTPANRLHTIDPSASLAQVLHLMSEHDVNQLPVMRARELVGILHRSDVMRFIEVRRDLSDHAPDATAPPPAPSDTRGDGVTSRTPHR